MGFKADEVVAPLDFDFRPHVADVHGVIQEPTDKQLHAFMKGVQNILLAITPKDIDVMSDQNKMLEALATMLDADNAASKALGDEVHSLCVAVCSGFPSDEQIMALPPRIRAHFYGWLTGQLVSPESSAAVM